MGEGPPTKQALKRKATPDGAGAAKGAKQPRKDGAESASATKVASVLASVVLESKGAAASGTPEGAVAAVSLGKSAKKQRKKQREKALKYRRREKEEKKQIANPTRVQKETNEEGDVISLRMKKRVQYKEKVAQRKAEKGEVVKVKEKAPEAKGEGKGKSKGKEDSDGKGKGKQKGDGKKGKGKGKGDKRRRLDHEDDMDEDYKRDRRMMRADDTDEEEEEYLGRRAKKSKGISGQGGKKGKGKGKGKGKDDDVEVGASGGQMGSELEGGPPVKKKAAPKAEASDTNAWHAQLLAQSFSMDLDNIDAPAEPGAEAADDALAPPKEPEKPKTGKWVSKEFHSELRARIDARADLGEAMADTVRLGEGPHWKQRYYFEKFKVKQDDLVDFLQRIRKAYVEGLCWVLVYYYQGCASWTWFYPYHYAPFASDLIGCSNLKCGELTYFQQGQPFMPFQQLMSVLPPASSEEAGVPPAMRELMKQPFSPLIDFYPVDFGLDLNGKRFTWLAVILLPFIDEPRLVRILGPLLKRLNANEKMRNRRGQELVFGHRDDKALFHAVQLAQAGFEAGHTGLKQTVRGDRYLFGFIEGWLGGGANKEVLSPIEGLPDVEESHAVCAMFTDPEAVPHTSKMLPGIQEMPLVVNAADMDEAARMKGFGGEPAKRMIMQALGKDANARPKYKDIEARQQKREGHAQAAASSSSAPKPGMAAPVAAAANPADALKFDYEEDETEFGDPMEESKVKIAPAPPAGTKVIRVRAAERERPAPPKAPQGFQPVRRPGQGAQGAGARGAPY